MASGQNEVEKYVLHFHRISFILRENVFLVLLAAIILKFKLTDRLLMVSPSIISVISAIIYSGTRGASCFPPSSRCTEGEMGVLSDKDEKRVKSRNRGRRSIRINAGTGNVYFLPRHLWGSG
ncbi:hypothetical protein K503DRAFT_93805 [Rhizopogon vinicolor AM-OR11-026]|uniref:Uncharacterized protein n=1 Tax=Rhizopogon vinicolor AM-OR11-026 TaxID=1314800 RepID=A0A1B7MFJ3_9AGAM|nr:hypothetical protein K503DRAFT_93805 [Rhizopogon vinicolor AM-OR11-026]